MTVGDIKTVSCDCGTKALLTEGVNDYEWYQNHAKNCTLMMKRLMTPPGASK